MPSSLGLVTVDVDKGGALAVTAVKALLGDPLAEVPSQTKEHFHLWYKSESKRKARYQWEIEGKGSGEVLYSTRSAILHNPNALVNGLGGYVEAPAVDVSQLPKPKKAARQRAETASYIVSSRRRPAAPTSRRRWTGRCQPAYPPTR